MKNTKKPYWLNIMSKFSLKKAKEKAKIFNKIIEMKILSDPKTYASYKRKHHEIELALLMRETVKINY